MFKVTRMIYLSAVILALSTSGHLSVAQLTITRQGNFFEVNPFSVSQRETLAQWFDQLSQKLGEQSQLTYNLNQQFASGLEGIERDQHQYGGNHSFQLYYLTETLQQVKIRLDELTQNHRNRSDNITLQLGYLQDWFDRLNQELEQQSQLSKILSRQFGTVTERLEQNQQHRQIISNQSSQIDSVTGALHRVELQIDVLAAQTKTFQNDSHALQIGYLQDWFDRLSRKFDQGSQLTNVLSQQIDRIAEQSQQQHTTSNHSIQLHSLTEVLQQVESRLSELAENRESQSNNHTLQVDYLLDWFDKLSKKLNQQSQQLAEQLNHTNQVVQVTNQLVGAGLQTIEQSQRNQNNSQEVHLQFIKAILEFVNRSQLVSNNQTARLQFIEESMQQVSSQLEQAAQSQQNRDQSHMNNFHDLTHKFNTSLQMLANRIEQMDRKQNKAASQSSQLLNNVTQSFNQLRAEIHDLRRAHKDSTSDASSRGGILIQQHYNGTNFFNRTWAQFKVGFGDVTGNYWIGNELLHHLTNDGRYKLQVDLQAKNNSQWYWAEYQTFKVWNESTQYRLEIGGYSGTAGDSMARSNGTKFSAKDRDNDLPEHVGHCAVEADVGNGGGFWYGNCADAFINSPSQGKFGFVWDRLPIVNSRIFDRKLRVSRLTLQLK